MFDTRIHLKIVGLDGSEWDTSIKMQWSHVPVPGQEIRLHEVPGDHLINDVVLSLDGTKVNVYLLDVQETSPGMLQHWEKELQSHGWE